MIEERSVVTLTACSSIELKYLELKLWNFYVKNNCTYYHLTVNDHCQIFSSKEYMTCHSIVLKSVRDGICELPIFTSPNKSFSIILLILEKLRTIFFSGSSMVTSYPFVFPEFFFVCFHLFHFCFSFSSYCLQEI